jgi:hypothetical protein
MTPEELDRLADDWIRFQREGAGDASSEASEWAILRLRMFDPEALWLLILAVHQKDQSPSIQGILSAGPVEDLLAQYGREFIDRVETTARNDPNFARMLGGVWKNRMTDDVWQRLQAVCDRRRWDDVRGKAECD